MADVDAKLAAAVKLAKTKPMFFAFVANGSQGKLLVDKKKIKPADAEAAKKECGGGQIYRGKCTWIDETMVFQVAKAAPASVANLTKKIIKSDTGLTLPVDYRVVTEADLEAEENETESTEEPGKPPEPPPSPSASPPPEANKAAVSFATRLKALQPVLQKVEAVALVLATQAKSQIAEGNKAFLAKQYEAANAALDRAETLLKQGLAGAVKETAPPLQSADGDVMKRLNAMTADIKAALAGPEKARVQSMFIAVNGFIKNKAFVQANKALDELAPLVKQVPAAAPPPPAANDAALSADWERRVTTLEPRVLDAQKTRAGEAKWMTMFMSAQDLGGEGDFAKSFAILDKLEGLLNAPSKAGDASPGNPSDKIIAGLVKYRTALLNYRSERATVISQLDNLYNAVVGTLPEEADLAQDLKERLDGTFAEMDDAIDEAINAAQNEREPYNKATRKLLQTFRKELRGDPLIQHVDSNPFVTVSVEATLGKALTNIENTMV